MNEPKVNPAYNERISFKAMKLTEAHRMAIDTLITHVSNLMKTEKYQKNTVNLPFVLLLNDARTEEFELFYSGDFDPPPETNTRERALALSSDLVITFVPYDDRGDERVRGDFASSVLITLETPGRRYCGGAYILEDGFSEFHWYEVAVLPTEYLSANKN